MCELCLDGAVQFVEHVVQRVGAGGHKGGLVHSGAFCRIQQAHMLHGKLHLIAVQACAAFNPRQRAGGNFAEVRAEGVPYLGFKTAAGVHQGEPPVGSVAGLALCRLTDCKQAPRFRRGANVFDVTTFFHISIQERLARSA